MHPICREVGVPYITFHGCRHTFASHLTMRGVHQVEVQKLLGHKKLESTQIYMHLADDHLDGITDCIDDDFALPDAKTGVVNLF